MLREWLGIGKATPIRTRREFHTFLSREAAHLAQTSATNFCRARAGWHADKLFGEAMFLDALDRCRWEAYAAVLADMIVIVEGRLRSAGTPQTAMPDALVAIYRQILESDPRPAHRSEGWDDVVAELGRRLAKAQLAAPGDPAKVARISGNRLYEVLPFDRSLIAGERDVVVNSVRFGMVGFCDRLDARLDKDVLRVELLGVTTP